MILTKARVTYKCPKCKRTKSIFMRTPTQIEHIERFAKGKEKICLACKIPYKIMEIKSRFMKDLKDPFGHRVWGMWKCEHHPAYEYYSGILKLTVRDGKVKNVLYPHYYIRIANMGFPWKCPICKGELIYECVRSIIE